jgi:hypothetical protein
VGGLREGERSRLARACVKREMLGWIDLGRDAGEMRFDVPHHTSWSHTLQCRAMGSGAAHAKLVPPCQRGILYHATGNGATGPCAAPC